MPNAHTNNDSYIKFENANVIHTGDVYRSTSYPYVDTYNGGSFVGIIQAHELLVELSDEDTKIIERVSMDDLKKFDQAAKGKFAK